MYHLFFFTLSESYRLTIYIYIYIYIYICRLCWVNCHIDYAKMKITLTSFFIRYIYQNYMKISWKIIGIFIWLITKSDLIQSHLIKRSHTQIKTHAQLLQKILVLVDFLSFGVLQMLPINSALLSRYFMEGSPPGTKLILFSLQPNRIAPRPGKFSNTMD